MRAEELQMAGVVSGAELFQEQPSKQSREYPHRQEEAGLAGDPAFTIQRQTTAGYDAMEVWMMGQGRAPGMQHGSDTQTCAETLGVSSDGEQGLCSGLEQQVVDHGLVVISDVTDRCWQGEHNMVVIHR